MLIHEPPPGPSESAPPPAASPPPDVSERVKRYHALNLNAEVSGRQLCQIRDAALDEARAAFYERRFEAADLATHWATTLSLGG